MWVIELKEGSIFEGNSLKELADKMAEFYVFAGLMLPNFDSLYWSHDNGEAYVSPKGQAEFEKELERCFEYEQELMEA